MEGGTWYNSSKCSVVSATAGANGKAEVLSGLSNHVGQSGLTLQSWYKVASGYSKDQTPGFVLFSRNHTHTWVPADSSCTETGTVNRYCTECKGTAFGTVTKPAHGHNFVDVEMGTDDTACLKGQQYYATANTSASNRYMSTWDGRANYWYSKQCTYCKEYAEPKSAYKIRYNNPVDKTQVLDNEFKYYGKNYTPYTEEQIKWTKTGYYIAYWLYKGGNVKYNFGDVEWPPGKDGIQQYFYNVPKKNEFIADVEAVWKPITYTLRIHENYPGAPGDNYKDYTLTYDKSFALPRNLWNRSTGTVLGYDWDREVKITPLYREGSQLMNLTTERFAIIDIWTIWDLPPKVTCPSEIHLDRAKVAAYQLNANDTTITRSDLEAYLMTLATAEDYEWQFRYGTKNVPSGSNKGYSFGVVAIEPAAIKDAAGQSERASTYYVTYSCTDDAGQTATATMTMFVGDKDVDILIH